VSDWLKAIRNHRGQQVQVTVMRNKQEQILTMSAGKPKKAIKPEPR
jgi:ribosomal protein L13E